MEERLKDCSHYEELFYETMERFIATKEGFPQLLQQIVEAVKEHLQKANDEHVLMPIVGVILAQAAAQVYMTMRRMGSGKAEALREAEAQLCGVYRYAARLLREMVDSGILDEAPSSPANTENPP